jgi:glutaredoxin-dependent peroxiredoxin
VPRVEAAGGTIAAVAVTATFSQMAFADRLRVPFPLLSDWGRETCGAYGVRYDVWKEHDGLAKRSLFVIDREGMIRFRWVTDDALVTPDEHEAIEVMTSL